MNTLRVKRTPLKQYNEENDRILVILKNVWEGEGISCGVVWFGLERRGLGDWLVGWLVKEREKGIKGREGHYRNFTITYHSYLSPG